MYPMYSKNEGCYAFLCAPLPAVPKINGYICLHSWHSVFVVKIVKNSNTRCDAMRSSKLPIDTAIANLVCVCVLVQVYNNFLPAAHRISRFIRTIVRPLGTYNRN